MPLGLHPSTIAMVITISIASLAVLHYFQGERRAVLVMLAALCALAGANMLLFLVTHDDRYFTDTTDTTGSHHDICSAIDRQRQPTGAAA